METRSAVELQYIVDTHDKPFVIIDRDFAIVAVNRAYERVYGLTRDQIVGRHCYEIVHRNDRPCFEFGEDCPYKSVYQTGKGCSCLHIHYDPAGRVHQVRLNAYPLLGSDGELYFGEAVEDLAEFNEYHDGQARMVGQSPAFLRMLEELKLAATTDAAVLLQGETGTGKDLAARFVHQHSSRCNKPFLTFDCTVLTESLFESEVFGHERGAFTGSVREKQGLFEQAEGGTLFLDEIGELPASLQAKLLRVLETGEYRRVGGSRTLYANVRIICATNRELGSDVASKKFREDLYYRVVCLHIGVPSLRERLQDVLPLAQTLLAGIGQATEKHYQLNPDSLMELQAYHYPGNIRELRNILSVAAAQATDGVIDAHNIADVIRCMKSRRAVSYNRRASDSMAEACRSPQSSRLERRAADIGFDSNRETKTAAAVTEAGARDVLTDMESRQILHLLEVHQGNRRKVASALGISERTMYRKLKRHGFI